ncbi:MAG: hypothetical protein JNG89_02510 [Planctomycetaceae bacterium]|nr:hypothetical protein [Planctomycetaceae bacterium]
MSAEKRQSPWRWVTRLGAVIAVVVILTVVLQLEQQRPVVELEREGAAVVQNSDGSVRTVSFCVPEAGDRHLQLIARLPTVTSVNLARSSITAAGLRQLAVLPHLHTLDLSETDDPELLQAVVDFPSLRTLQLRRCHWINDETLAPLANVKTLECVMIAESSISDASLAMLSQSPQLKQLGMDRCPHITDAGLAMLAEHSHLESVSINDCDELTDAGVRTLAGLSTLRNLSGCGIAMHRPVLLDLADNCPSVALTLDRFEIPELQPLIDMGAQMNLDSSYRVASVEIDDRWHAPTVKPPYSMAMPGEHGVLAAEPDSRPITITDDMLQRLSLVPEVSVLTLHDVPLSDAALSPIRELPNLSKLVIDNVPITEDALQLIADCRSLEALWLRRVPISGEGAAALQRLPKLRELSLLSDCLTQAGIETLTKLPGLQTLAIGDVSTASIVSPLCGMPRLERLALVRARLTADDVQRLATVAQLKEMELLSVDLRGGTLLQFEEMTSLRSLFLARCEFDRAALEELRDRRPDLMVYGTFESPRRPVLTPMMPERRWLLGGIPLFLPHAPTAIH